MAYAGSYQRAIDSGAWIWNDNPKPGQEFSWSGRKDRQGYATGKGTLAVLAPQPGGETGTRMLSARRHQAAARYYGRMVRGKFVGASASPVSTPRNNVRRKVPPPPVTRPAQKKSSPPAPATSPVRAASPAASPVRALTATPPPSTPAPSASASPGDSSLNELTHPPASLGLQSPAESPPHPTPEASASPPP